MANNFNLFKDSRETPVDDDYNTKEKRERRIFPGLNLGKFMFTMNGESLAKETD